MGVRGWGGSGGAAPPCTPSASLSLPPVHSLCPPWGDGDGGGPLLLRQRPGGAQGVGITLGVVVPRLEVSGASGGFVQGGQTTRGGLRGARGAAEPRRDPLRLDADGVVLRGAAGGRVLGGDNPGAGPGVRREGEAGCPHAASLADTQGVGRVSPPPNPSRAESLPTHLMHRLHPISRPQATLGGLQHPLPRLPPTHTLARLLGAWFVMGGGDAGARSLGGKFGFK